MLRILNIKLELPEGERIHQAMASLMHGALMEKLPQKTAEELHTKKLRPYSQALFFDNAQNAAVWRFAFLNDEIYDIMSPFLLENSEYFLKQKNYSIFLRSKEETIASFDELADRIFLAETVQTEAKFQFITTTTFKRDGKYVIFPDIYLIFQSLLNRWNTFTDGAKLEENELSKKLQDFSYISRYNLRSDLFSAEGKYICGFKGDLIVKFHGSDAVNRLIKLLTLFAPFSGIGVKTALGMGAVNTF